MADISRGKTWVTGDILTASDLNNEFNIIHNLVNGTIDSDNLGTLTTLTFNNSTSSSNVISITKTGTGNVFEVTD